MKVLIHDFNSAWHCEIEIDSRPNVGDGIYLSDFKHLNINFDESRYSNKYKKKLTSQIKKKIENSDRFVVTDVVFGKLCDNKMQWIIQGILEGFYVQK